MCVPFLGIELAFLAANSTKIKEGGWMPLAIGGIVFLMMTTWKKGRHLLSKSFPETLSLREFVASTASQGRPCFSRASPAELQDRSCTT